MTIDEARVIIHEELRKQASLTPQDLSDRANISVMMCFKVMKADVEQGIVTMEIINEAKRYSLVADVVQDTTAEPVEESAQAEESIKEEKLVYTPQSTSGRDVTKFIFKKKPYGKSACVLAVVTDYVTAKQPSSLEELKQVFPDSIVGRFGVVNKLEGEKGAKALSPDRPRYFMKPEHLLTLQDGTNIAVCNQFSLTRFMDFLEAAAKAGYKIKPE